MPACMGGHLKHTVSPPSVAATSLCSMESRCSRLVLCVLGAVCVAHTQECPSKFATMCGDDGKSFCSRCRPGTFMQEECTPTSDSVCVPCPQGTYSSQWNILYSCFRCAVCGYEGMTHKRNCTPSSNAQCECSKGYVCKDSDCRTCILPDEDMESIPCSTGTFSNTGTEPCQPWTNCTSLGHIEIAPANQTRDAICDYTTQTPTKGPAYRLEVVTNMVAFIILFLLCLLVGVHFASCRKQEFNLLPGRGSGSRSKGLKVAEQGETQAALRNTLSDDTNSIHYPEQECGGTSQPEKKSTQHTYVDVPCVC